MESIIWSKALPTVRLTHSFGKSVSVRSITQKPRQRWQKGKKFRDSRSHTVKLLGRYI